MKTPCNDCPFRADASYCLSTKRKEDIAKSVILGDDGFPCHKTVDYSVSRHDSSKTEKPCIGAALMVERVRGDMSASLYFRLAAMIGLIDRDDCDRSVELSQDWVNICTKELVR